MNGPDARGYFGEFGGRFVPEVLIAALDELGAAVGVAFADTAFWDEYHSVLRDFVGRPSPIYRCERYAADILAVYRLRWQIELAFKRLKSPLHIDRLPTRTERGSRSWLNAHLILALLCDDLSQDFLDSSP